MVLPGVTIKLVPEPASVPPQPPVYQSTVHPLSTDADRVEDSPELIVDGFAAGLVGAFGPAVTVTVTAVPQLELTQPSATFRARG